MLRATLFICIFSLMACNSSSKLNKDEYSPVNNTDELEKMGSGLIKSNDCYTCHSFEQRIVGPSFRAISEKYNEASVDMLAQEIIKGGSGHWGQLPMLPHPKLAKTDAQIIASYILSLKNK